MDLGGAPADYDLGGERVFLKSDPTKGLTYAQAAQRAIELGGKFDGHENPTDINPMTAAAATSLAGSGLIGVAKDNLPITASPAAFVAGFAEIQLDTETGAFDIVDYVAVADCGTVIHPQGLATQIKGGAVMGFGLATLERHIYDPQNGLPGAVGLLSSEARNLSRRRADVHDGRRRFARPAKPARHEGHRRARHGRRRLGALVRDLRCARRTLLQPRARDARSHRQRAREAAAVAQAAAGQHGLSVGGRFKALSLLQRCWQSATTSNSLSPLNDRGSKPVKSWIRCSRK